MFPSSSAGSRPCWGSLVLDVQVTRLSPGASGPIFPTYEKLSKTNGTPSLSSGSGRSVRWMWRCEAELFPLTGDHFQFDEAPTAERMTFDTVVDGKALRLIYSGQAMYRV